MQVTLQLNTSANICGNDQFILTVKPNEVFAADSLQGFELDIRYNPEEITFNNIIWKNTLGEQCDLKDAQYDTYTSKPRGGIFIQASKFPGSGYVKGNVPFVILIGKFHPKCKVTSTVFLTDVKALYEFGILREEPQFQMVIDTFANKTPNSKNRIIVSAARPKLELTNRLRSDTVAFDIQTTGSVLRVDSLIYLLRIADTSNFVIDNCWVESKYAVAAINPLNRHESKLVIVANSSDSFTVKLKAKISSKTAAIKDTIKSAIALKLSSIPDCHCVANITNDSVSLSYHEMPSSVHSFENHLETIIPTLDKNNISDWILNHGVNGVTVTTLVGTYQYFSQNDLHLGITALPIGLYLLRADNSTVIAKYLQY